MYREIKIFTELERLKNGEESKEHSEANKQCEIGLPHLLCYCIDENDAVGELLMTDGGKNLSYWQE